MRYLVVPRTGYSHGVRAVFVAVRLVYAARLGRRREYARRDHVMASYGAVGFLATHAAFVASLASGYALLYAALGQSPGDAIQTSGSSLLTLGFIRPDHGAAIAASFSEAALGLFLLALVVSYLPALYAAYTRREHEVAKLAIRAGGRASGIDVLRVIWSHDGEHSLRLLWETWEDWFVSISETHGSYPVLIFFRSSHADRSWITAAGAILDAAALAQSCLDIPGRPEADFCLEAGVAALERLAGLFGIPAAGGPDDALSVHRDEFDAGLRRLSRAGLPLRSDEEQRYAAWMASRRRYDRALVGMARLVVAPEAPWTSDRQLEDTPLPLRIQLTT